MGAIEHAHCFNFTTSKVMGLDVPSMLVAHADEVIE